MSTSSSKASSPQSGRSYCFLFRFPASSVILMVIKYLLMSLSSCSLHFYPLIKFYLNNVFEKAVPAPEVTDPVSLPYFILYIGYSPLVDSLYHFFMSHTIGPTDLLQPSPAPRKLHTYLLTYSTEHSPS